ncbi:hypothetical protein P153DRAFT_428873 [Dothidotthia symphoricarpi CBS 119687]|uniref:Meiotically up-regulated protein Msb1/Mug8 domain-containing protein n=1 Tax=Dothidotthia symphoricarpi CBS 119687 TaxID=1392245 RepID=A0A6A6ALI5_9PLEO|nr:uncharacterized protein P153DRAFT_428873 [Dothidotthia symphoricarpi CBS 119687]KAF2132842.1 hypothetical protein P153DRAFT_428873 [Dothidotthia symphoricarpi CBS 119687]
MPFFKNVFKSKDATRSASKASKNDAPVAPPKPRWEDAWSRKDVAPEEIQELIHVCTQEMKSRALDMLFMLLPFRPASDTSASRNFVRSFFKAAYEGTQQFKGEGLSQELRLAEPLTLCSILKWCWSRLPGGVVTWDAYELFRTGESDSNFARHAFDTFIPLSTDSEYRTLIIFDFFDLLSSVAARGKTNGMGGRKLSRMAGWWAFEFVDDGKGFDGGYRTWEKAADAASHLFFAYLRSLSPDPNAIGGVVSLPRSLLSLLSQTEYPPQTPTLMQTRTTKVVMIVDSVSPTPFSLLRRAKNFEYRDDDAALQQFSAYDDTVKALTDECRRVLECVASVNQSVASPDATTPDAPSWSRFEDFGFSGIVDASESNANGTSMGRSPREFSNAYGARSKNNDFGRPTTPSWAEFLSSGFANEGNQASPTTLLLPMDKLPPLGEAARVHSSQSHMRNVHGVEEDLEPGELASITQFDLDETFWWVWMTSLANEETIHRKAAFGRCTLIETRIPGARWLVMEEQVKGATVGPEDGAYIAEKKSKFSFTKRNRLGRRKSTGKKGIPTLSDPYVANAPMSKTSIGPDQHARIQAAAAKLAQQDRDQKAAAEQGQRRGRMDETSSVKTNSVLTLQPHLLSEAGPAMKWDKHFGEGVKDRDALRAQYLGDLGTGKGSSNNLMITANGGRPATLSTELSNRELPALPKSERTSPSVNSAVSNTPTPIATSASPYAEVAPVTRVPWPNDSPPASPFRDDDKPPIAAITSPHPALRAPVPDRKPVAASYLQVRTSEDQARTMERKPSTRTAKRREGGFRNFFGRKKTDEPVTAGAMSRRESEENARLRTRDTSRSVSRVEHHDTPVQELSRAPSTEKPTPDPVPEPVQEPIHEPAQEPVLEPSPAFEPTPAASPGLFLNYRNPDPPVAPNSNAYEQQKVDQAFSRFDQGPMEDMPAFAPADSDDEVDVTAAPVHQVEPTMPIAPTQYAPPTRDDASEESVELERKTSPQQDRWAQIRRNAADRAAKLSEEQTRRSRSQSQRTDEGETSGEETIESRVARIKARVAELTGNPEGQSPGGGVGAYGNRQQFA